MKNEKSKLQNKDREPQAHFSSSLVFKSTIHNTAWLLTVFLKARDRVIPDVTKPRFIPGLKLARGYFHEVVEPLISLHMPRLKYAAGLFGHGSEVLGYDSRRSMDHNWGPQVRIILPDRDFDKTARAVGAVMCDNLPYEYKGFSTNYTDEREGEYLNRVPRKIRYGPVNHLTEFHTIKGFFQKYITFDPHKKPTERDWLLFPEQSLLEVTAGEVWRDDVGFQKYRNKFEYYPRDVWKYVMAVQWEKIAWEEPFMARTGEAGDELGSHIIAIMIVQNIMRLCFYLEKTYMPYRKWFGVAFSELECYEEINPMLKKVVSATNWQRREKYLIDSYQIIAKLHNNLRITKHLQAKPVTYHGRPYQVIRAERFHKNLMRKIRSKFLKNLKMPMGSIDQFMNHLHLSDTKIYTEAKPMIR